MSLRFQPPFHQTQIRDYSICPKRFYFAHVVGIEAEHISPKMFFGTVMHKLMYDLHKVKRLELLTAKVILHRMINILESDENLPVNWADRQKEIDDFITDAIPTLQNYWSKPFNRDARILFAEAEFEVKIGSFDFAGRIDQLRQTPDGELILIDFKSGKAGVDDLLIELDYQLSIYAWACMHGRFKNNEIFGNESLLAGEQGIDKVGIYRLQDHLPYKKNGKAKNYSYKKGDERGQGLYTTTRTDKDFDAMIQDLGIICRSIVGPHYDSKTNKLKSGGAFGRTPNIMNCSNCPFKAECIAERRADINQEHLDIQISQEDIV